MRDKRPVDELSIEELERILAVRKREARMQQVGRMKRDGRVVVDTRTPQPLADVPEIPKPQPAPMVPQQQAAIPSFSMATASAAASAHPHFDDDDAALAASQATPPIRAQNRQVLNRLLLGVEVAAVIGIVVIALNLFQAVGTLERETETAQRLSEEQRRAGIPTLAPTPTIRLENIVLPTGHIYSDAGIVEFNLNEIPTNLRPVVQSQLLQPVIDRPPPTDETAQRIVIPKINIDQVIVPGTDPEALRLGVGQLINGVNANDSEGNLVLAAHNDIYGEIFRHLDQLEPGDPFTIYTQIQAHEYVIASRELVQPNAVWVMENQPGRARLTV